MSRWFWWTLPLMTKQLLSVSESENEDIFDKLASLRKLSGNNLDDKN
jgi:hypothetical protein